MAITSLVDFRAYIKRKLGDPVMTIELHDDQIDDAITDSIQDLNYYNYGEGNFKDYFALNISAGQDEYSLSGEDINDVFDLVLSTDSSGRFNSQLFTPVNLFLSSENLLWTFANFDLVSYDIALTYLKEVENQLGLKFRVDYIPQQELLKIVPTPATDHMVLLQVYKKETALNLYNHHLVKKLSVARAMKQWGLHLTKYTMTLPGGGTINGEAILSQGKEDEVIWLKAMEDESEPIDFFVG